MSSYKSDLISELDNLVNAINLKADSSGAKSLSDLNATVRGIKKRKPEQVGDITPDFSSGNQTVYPSTGKVFSSVTITKPVTLIAGNIAKGITIAGITGTYDNSVRTEDITLELNMANGNQYIYPDDGYGALTSVTIQKPDTLIPENIVKDVDIGGVIGTFEGGGGGDLPSSWGWHYFDGNSFSQKSLQFYDGQDDQGDSPDGYYYVSAGGSDTNSCIKIDISFPTTVGDYDTFEFNGHHYKIICESYA